MASEPAAGGLPKSSPDETRVLLLPPTRRDADALQKVLAGEGIGCAVCVSVSAMCTDLAQGAGAILLSEELVSGGAEALAAVIRGQPLWSDVPIIVLSRAGAEGPKLGGVLPSLGNVSVLERPVRVSTLISVVRSALRARARQYQMREHLAELAQLQQAERAARSDAELASRMKDEFLATLSHELRTPLNAILGWSQILATSGSKNPDDLGEGLRTIERNARAQTQIIEDLLDMSRIISGKVRLDVQRIDLASVVREAIVTATPAAEAKTVRLQSVLDPSAGPVSGDPNRLQQVMWNLLSNAIKFTPRGGRVQVLLERVNSHLEVSVSDTGEGIKPEFLPYVFDRFRQADASTTRRHGGLGLGLAIVRQLVELHGGDIRVTSPGEGMGSTFTVSLPMTVVHPEPEPERLRRHPVAPAATALPLDICRDLSGVSVLVVDDEPDARSLIRRLLTDCAAVVTTAGSVAEALELFRTTPPDVLVSDIGMPTEDGYKLIEQIRALGPERGGDVPAVALTAYARAEDRIRSIVAGYQLHISKPVEPAELISMVATLAGRAR